MILVFYQYAYIDFFNEYAYICVFRYNRGSYKIIEYNANKYNLYLHFGDPNMLISSF